MVKNITQSLSSLWEQLMKSKTPKALPQQYEPWMYLLVPDTQLLSWFPSQRQQLVLAKRRRQWRVAAAILFLGGLSAMGGVLFSGERASTQVKTGEYQKRIALADGSVIHLNAHSSLQYNAHFGEKKRQLKLLRGEAYFNVAPTGIPFELNLPDKSQIQVLGTAFNVQIDPNHQRIATFLEEGRVHWKKKDNTQQLQPGDWVATPTHPKAGSDQWEKRQLKAKEIQATMQWKAQPFSFNNTPLANIALELETYYQIKIKVTKSIKKDPFTGTFPRDMPLQKILEIISSTTNYQLEEKDHSWSIK